MPRKLEPVSILINGRTISAIRWIDEKGSSTQIVQLRLGDKIVFDGTVATATGEVYTGHHSIDPTAAPREGSQASPRSSNARPWVGFYGDLGC